MSVSCVLTTTTLRLGPFWIESKQLARLELQRGDVERR